MLHFSPGNNSHPYYFCSGTLPDPRAYTKMNYPGQILITKFWQSCRPLANFTNIYHRKIDQFLDEKRNFYNHVILSAVQNESLKFPTVNRPPKLWPWYFMKFLVIYGRKYGGNTFMKLAPGACVIKLIMAVIKSQMTDYMCLCYENKLQPYSMGNDCSYGEIVTVEFLLWQSLRSFS